MISFLKVWHMRINLFQSHSGTWAWIEKVANNRFRLSNWHCHTDHVFNKFLVICSNLFLSDIIQSFSNLFLVVSVFAVFCSKFNLSIKLLNCQSNYLSVPQEADWETVYHRRCSEAEHSCRLETACVMASGFLHGQNISFDFHLELQCCRFLKRPPRVLLKQLDVES